MRLCTHTISKRRNIMFCNNVTKDKLALMLLTCHNHVATCNMMHLFVLTHCHNLQTMSDVSLWCAWAAERNGVLIDRWWKAEILANSLVLTMDSDCTLTLSYIKIVVYLIWSWSNHGCQENKGSNMSWWVSWILVT